MKNVLASLVLVLLLFSCKKEPVHLNSDFVLGDDLVRMYDLVDVRNLSDSISVRYSWDFGDGFTSVERNPRHSYMTAGNYTIRLEVSDKFGNATTTVKTVRVGERVLYGIVVASLTEKKWSVENQRWDEDGVGLEQLPDIFVEIKGVDKASLFQSEVVYNMDQSKLPLSFDVPEVVINPNKTLDMNGVYLNDKDAVGSETIVSNELSGISVYNDVYDKISHTGEVTLAFGGNAFIQKYRVK